MHEFYIVYYKGKYGETRIWQTCWTLDAVKDSITRAKLYCGIKTPMWWEKHIKNE